MTLRDEREKIAEFGRRMLKEGLVRGTGGNISIFNRKECLIAISPSGRDYNTIRREDVPVVNTEGEVVEGEFKASSELPMHLKLYLNRDDVSGVIHNHSPFAAAYSCLRKELPPIYYLMTAAGGSIRCADYALSGSEELAENVLRAIHGRSAALLANHGVIVGASTLEKAYFIAEQVEFGAELCLRSGGGGNDSPVSLSEREQREMYRVFVDLGYGIPEK